MGSSADRRTDRISISLNLEAAGIDAENQPFIEHATTAVLNRHGALLVLKRHLRAGQTLKIIRQLFNGSRREAEVRVVACEKEDQDGNFYGISFTDPELDFWGIGFPPSAKSTEAVVRLLVECSHCRNQELAYLDSRELMEFEANRLFARQCRTCECPTIWRQPLDSLRHKSDEQTAGDGTNLSSAANRETTRYDTRLTACVRECVGKEEMAVCENVSRQGIAFRSRKKYEEGSEIEVAVPFTQGAANVFVPALVVHVRALPAAGLYRHGIKYVRRNSSQSPEENKPLH